MGDVAWPVGVSLLAPHMDPQQIKFLVGGQVDRERVSGSDEGGNIKGSVVVSRWAWTRMARVTSRIVSEKLCCLFRLQFGWRNPGLLGLAEGTGNIAFFQLHQVFGSRVEKADSMEIRFNGSNENEGVECAILVRTVDPTSGERGAVELLVDLSRGQGTTETAVDIVLIGKGMESVDERASNPALRSGPTKVAKS